MKYSGIRSGMNSSALLLLVFLSGSLVTYLVTLMPWPEILGGKRQEMTAGDRGYHETSVMLRGRQQHPVNSGNGTGD